MPSKLPFPAFQGTDPYLFASYAHADSAVVYPEMEWLHGLGHRIWYDEGIPIGSKWTESIAQAIDNCAQFLVFMSPSAALSENVQDEIHYALEIKKTILCVHLQKTELSAGLKMRLGRIQAILKHELSEEDYRTRLKRVLVHESRSAPGVERQVPAPPRPAAVGVEPSQPASVPMKPASAPTPKATVQLRPSAPAAAPVRTRKAGDPMTGPQGIELVWCPPGTFAMGSPPGERERSDDEAQHQVTLTQGFWLGKYPVTQEQWEKVMGSNPSQFKGGRNPVENLSWDDAREFMKKLGSGFRLPTEAEWEYACRAGSESAFCFGDEEGKLKDFAWYSGNSGAQTRPVGQKKANAWGLYDMHGNVFEWCADWYGSYPRGPLTDPTGPPSGQDRVYRGGSWSFDARVCRSAYRNYWRPDSRFNFLGFRVAASSIPSSPGGR